MITLRGTRVQVLIYDEEMNIKQVIYSPSISAVTPEIKLDDFDIEGVKGVIASYIILGALRGIEEPIPLLLPSSMKKQLIFVKASYIDDTLWEEHLRPLKDKLEKKQEEFERKAYYKRSMQKVRDSKGKKKKVMYFMNIVRKDTGEIFKIVTQPTPRALANQIGIPTRIVKLYISEKYKTIVESKRKGMQEAIEKYGLEARIQING